jgi:hypothetical protein
MATTDGHLTVLHNFNPQSGGTGPAGGLVLGTDGNLLTGPHQAVRFEAGDVDSSGAPAEMFALRIFYGSLTEVKG